MQKTYLRFFAHSAIALGLSAVLAGCGQDNDAQAQQSKPVVQQNSASHGSADNVSSTANDAALQNSAASQVVASLGNVSITQAELQRFLDSLPTPQRDAMRRDRLVLEQWLRTRLAEKAVVAQAVAQDWHNKPDVKSILQETRDQVILRSYLLSVSEPAADYPSEQDLQTAYEANKAQFQLPALYRISQIYLAVPPNDAQATARVRKDAQAFVKQLRDGKANFADLAREYSNEPASAQRGGDNGYLPLAQLTPTVRDVVVKMKVDQVSDPIVQADGIHILQLTDVQQARVRTLEEVKPALRDALRRQRQQDAAQAYVSSMLDTGTVAIDGKMLSSVLETTVESQ